MVRYRKASTGDVCVLDWDGEQLLYQFVSGETHYLNSLGAITFACLGADPIGLTEMRQRVLLESGLDAGQGLDDAELQRVLDRFVELGLAEAGPGSQ